MKLFIFRTNIKTKKKVKRIKPLFNNHSGIIKWSIDLEDIDNVLRIEAFENFNETEVINLINMRGFYCDELSD